MGIAEVNLEIERAQRLMEGYKLARKDGDNERMRQYAEAVTLCMKFAMEEMKRTNRKDQHDDQESPKEQ